MALSWLSCGDVEARAHPLAAWEGLIRLAARAGLVGARRGRRAPLREVLRRFLLALGGLAEPTCRHVAGRICRRREMQRHAALFGWDACAIEHLVQVRDVGLKGAKRLRPVHREGQGGCTILAASQLDLDAAQLLRVEPYADMGAGGRRDREGCQYLGDLAGGRQWRCGLLR
jgi:hypothetical protein